VEKLRKYSANPTTSPSASATSAKTAGEDPNRAARSWPSVAFTSCRARSYSARSQISRWIAATSSTVAVRMPAGSSGSVTSQQRSGAAHTVAR
jgi:hypothetical protein